MGAHQSWRHESLQVHAYDSVPSPRHLGSRHVSERLRGGSRKPMAETLNARANFILGDSQDLAFLAYYVIVFSFLRQFWTIHILRPLAWKLGIKKEAKLDRFAEQGYAVVYFSTSGALGLVRNIKLGFVGTLN